MTRDLTLKELFDRCREQWGLNAQILMLAEECSELSVATLHLFRNAKQEDALDHFAEEIADVELMLAEMKYYFKNVSLIAKWRKFKEKRLEKKLEKYYVPKKRGCSNSNNR